MSHVALMYVSAAGPSCNHLILADSLIQQKNSSDMLHVHESVKLTADPITTSEGSQLPCPTSAVTIQATGRMSNIFPLTNKTDISLTWQGVGVGP